jgi:hypothetical protein
MRGSLIITGYGNQPFDAARFRASILASIVHSDIVARHR